MTDSVDNTKSTNLLADVTDDSCIFQYPYIEVVPLTRDTDGPCSTEHGSGDCCAQVKQEYLPVMKQEPQDVCYTGSVSYTHLTLPTIYSV